MSHFEIWNTSRNVEVVGDSLYFVSKQDCLVRLDTKRLEAAIKNKNKTEMYACESVVC